MEPISLQLLARAAGDNAPHPGVVTQICTDTRQLTPGCLFVALQGERFDGHDFVPAALAGGAIAAVVHHPVKAPAKQLIQVEDTQRALLAMAACYRDQFPALRLTAVTGSVGKTTTKEMMACVLESAWKTLKTEGNLNNEIGVPMTLLRLGSEHEIAVLELGMNHAGEIDYLSAMVEPDAVLMTNIGDSHIEHFGSREKILEAKSEIFHHAKPDAFVVINGDDPLLSTLPGTLPFSFTRVGGGEGLDYRAVDVESDGASRMTCRIVAPSGEFPVEIPALGDHMIYPTLMAAAVGEHFGLTHQQIADGVLHFAPTKMRMNILHRGEGITILNDTYNANPQSMRAAVQVLSGAKGEYKVAVLGDMFELGPLAPALHAGIGDYLGKAGIDCLVAVGELAKHIYDAAQAAGVPDCRYCPDKEAAKPVLDSVVRPGTTVLVKASRGMAMEQLVDYLLGITKEV